MSAEPHARPTPQLSGRSTWPPSMTVLIWKLSVKRGKMLVSGSVDVLALGYVYVRELPLSIQRYLNRSYVFNFSLLTTTP